MFKDNLIEERKKHNDTQDALALKLNVSRSLVAKWEQGRSFPSLDDINKICEIYSLEFDDLLSKAELKERYGVVEKKNKRKNIIITSIIICASLFIITLSIILFIISIGTTGAYYKSRIKDEFTNNYEFKLPFEANNMTFAGDYYFDNDISFDEMEAALKNNGHVVERGTYESGDEYLILSFFYEDRFAPMFIIYEINADRYCVAELTDYIDYCTYSSPLHFIDKERTKNYNLKNETTNYLAINVGFEELVSFYEKTVSGIIKIDIDNKIIYVKAKSSKLGYSINSVMKIEYMELADGNYIEVNKVSSFN